MLNISFENIFILQTLYVLKFIDNYLNENPLCIAYDEVSTIKSLLRSTDDSSKSTGELKCIQKTSCVSFNLTGGDYFYKVKLYIPDTYPAQCIGWLDHKTNFPDTLQRFLTGQAKEIARKCVEPPLRGDPNKFIVKPSLLPTFKFLFDAVNDFPNELCPVCERQCLPNIPNDVELNDTADAYIERVYCGHIFHLGCLRKFMREPPFPPGGKICPAKKAHPRSDHKGILTIIHFLKKIY